MNEFGNGCAGGVQVEFRTGRRMGGWVERRVSLGITENVRRVCARRARLSVDGTGIERAGVVGEWEDVLFLEMIKEMMEVRKNLAATCEVGALRRQ